MDKISSVFIVFKKVSGCLKIIKKAYFTHIGYKTKPLSIFRQPETVLFL
ncbi:MAG: hypothetical protein J6T41_03855 [Neisseriaceae bacterium]|nr:hypothetical protein [Neisseriaceae bacterium]